MLQKFFDYDYIFDLYIFDLQKFVKNIDFARNLFYKLVLSEDHISIKKSSKKVHYNKNHR